VFEALGLTTNIYKDGKMTKIYLVLTFLGVLLPYGAFVPWLLENGLS
jgi:hypothetical protein